MNKKILIITCGIASILTGCGRENPLINDKALSTLHATISAGQMPGKCRHYFREETVDPSMKVKCDQKAEGYFNSLKAKEPFLRAKADDMKDPKLWQQFYSKYPEFDFFIG